ncbi:MAG: Uma2 family endonuclease [Candidatus Eremiobacteraeota bacterium]|nr:Uma2 family endonuclease [Candidatus Eremiobacteraeota bacterium]
MEGPTPGRTSIAEFEQLLAASDQKLELLDGKVVAFAPASIAHGMLCSRLHNAVSTATKPPCHTFTSDVAIRVADRSAHLFPDVSRTCEPLDVNAMHITGPDLVIEVISAESKARDQGAKLDIYRSIPSVMEYLLVDSRRVWVCVSRRTADGFWTETTYGMDETAELRTAGVSIDVAELYAGTGRVLAT